MLSLAGSLFQSFAHVQVDSGPQRDYYMHKSAASVPTWPKHADDTSLYGPRLLTQGIDAKQSSQLMCSSLE
ncbi:hypothetical protein WJX74_002855 [Apatococcus lobatus]|uniref:Uncharacterized protein n=1 Tax=Apatococcus lobatus TaxID=904363 RepID=A0AAW1RYT3_9CHLO